MTERASLDLANAFAEVMLVVMESEYQSGLRDPDAMMRRLKDLSAYSLVHAEILEQREGVELLALGLFFGMTSHPGFRDNQNRLHLLSDEAVGYKGQRANIEREIARRNKQPPSHPPATPPGFRQERLL